MGACGMVAYFPYESAASGQWVGRRAAATAPLPGLGEFAYEREEDHALGLKVPGYLYTITTSAFCTHYQ